MNRFLNKSDNFKCPLCTKKYDNRRGFGTHLGIKHPEYGGVEKYVLEIQLKGIKPLCLCGCGQETSWHKTQYRFVDYISGHNDSGFDIGTYKLTTEERQRANATLRAKIDDPIEGPQLRKRISEGVKKSFENPVNKKTLVDALLKSWEGADERKEKRSKDSKLLWKQPGHYEKIFTPEMRRKISVSNMKRNKIRVSKEEEDFVDHLKKILGENDVITPAWINSKKYGTASYDVYVKSQRCRIEYDGIHHHGLDRSSGWSDWQLHNMKNDIRKNEMILERPGSRLLRIRSDSNWQMTNSFDDLVMIAYKDIKSEKIGSDSIACDSTLSDEQP